MANEMTFQEALAEAKMPVQKTPIVREGPRWRLTIIAIVLSFLSVPVLTIGFITLSNQSQIQACTAVDKSNRELIRFLRARVDPDGQKFVTDLARQFDEVSAQCR